MVDNIDQFEIDVDGFIKRWTEASFERFRDELRKLVLPAVYFRRRLSGDNQIGIGNTKLGGQPDLRDPALWPRTDDGRLIGFVAQINLKQMAAYQLDNDLPKEGLLSFFVDVESFERFYHAGEGTIPTGYSPGDGDKWRVLYEPNMASLQRIDFPSELPLTGRSGVAAITPHRLLTMPFSSTNCVEQLGLDEDERWRFDDLSRSAWDDMLTNDNESEANHSFGHVISFLGHAFPIQGAMQSVCQFASHGITDFKHDERIPALRGGIGEWRHLFQLEAWPELGMDFAGDGVLYFWVRGEDLLRCDFQHVWMVLQIA